MRIAICDDCPADMRRLEELIRKHTEHPEKIQFDEFLNGEALLEHGEKHDIIFLDILINGEEEGVKTADLIRRKGEDALLVFYTAYDYPASSIMRVQPFHYLLKDDCTENIAEGLQQILCEANRRKQAPLIPAVYQGTKYMLKPEDILYIAILDKGTGIYPTGEKASAVSGLPEDSKTLKGFVMKSSVKLNEHYAKLRDCGFAYAKKSYIINVHYIAARMKETVQLKDGTILNVARSRRREFESSCSSYWGRTGVH